MKTDELQFFRKGWRMQNMYYIRTEWRTLALLKFNEIQQKTYDYVKKNGFKGLRVVVSKARKMGVSTFWLIFYLDDTLFTPNTTTCIIAHTRQDVQKLFKIVKLAYNKMPDEVEFSTGEVWRKPKAKYDNKNELEFDGLNSRIYVALESRGDTNNNLHISEAAFINDEEKLAGTIASVPKVTLGSNISVESTANGVGGYYYDEVMAALKGESNKQLLFFPWYVVEKNTIPAPHDFKPTMVEELMAAKVFERTGFVLSNDQLYWWRYNKQEMKRIMDQEHPTFMEDAFLMSGNMAFDAEIVNAIVPIDPILFKKFRIRMKDEGEDHFVSIFKKPKPGRRYVVALDPADGGGGDDNSIQVFDVLTLEQVAEYNSNKIKPKKAAYLAADVAVYYNGAVVAPEINAHGEIILEALKERGSTIFQMVKFDEKTKKKTKKLGWRTGGNNRDIILDELEDVMMDGTIKINSAILKTQLQTFIVNENTLKREAKSGQKDDAVISSAIAVKVARMPRSSFRIHKV